MLNQQQTNFSPFNNKAKRHIKKIPLKTALLRKQIVDQFQVKVVRCNLTYFLLKNEFSATKTTKLGCTSGYNSFELLNSWSMLNLLKVQNSIVQIR